MNRIDLPRAMPAFLFPGDLITLAYNATAARWEVASWPNQGMAMGFTMFDDFLTVQNVGAGLNAQAGVFAGGTVGTASLLQPTNNLVDTTEKPAGVVRLGTGTDTNGRVVIGGERGNAANQIVPAQGCAGSIARVARVNAPSAAEDYTLVAGFSDGHGGTWTDGAAWELYWNGTAEVWSQTTSRAGTKTRSTTGSPTPDATFAWLAVFLNAAWSEAYFIWSQDSKTFTYASAVSTNLPAAANLTGWGIILQKAAGTTSRDAYADLAGWRADTGARG